MVKANTVLFTLLSGCVFTYSTVYILSPFDKFVITKKRLALSLASFTGITILGYFVVEDILNSLLQELKVIKWDIYSNDMVVLSTLKGVELLHINLIK
jgi:hypothetical protein